MNIVPYPCCPKCHYLWGMEQTGMKRKDSLVQWYCRLCYREWSIYPSIEGSRGCGVPIDA